MKIRLKTAYLVTMVFNALLITLGVKLEGPGGAICLFIGLSFVQLTFAGILISVGHTIKQSTKKKDAI